MKEKKKKNKKIIEFRYYLINSLYPTSGKSETPIATETKLNDDQRELLQEVLLKFNIHFGTKYDLG